MAFSYAWPARSERPSAPAPAPRRELAELGALLAGHFPRREPREAAEGYLRALLDQTGGSNSWRLAARAGDDSPWRMQRLLTRARWDEEALRHSAAQWLAGHLGHRAAILRLGQDHMPKKGTRTVAVARQYRDETGRVENCQAMVLLSYLSPRGHALLDRELYLPREWCADPARCRAAGVPEERQRHRTPGRLARTVIERARTAGVPFTWVSGGVVHGLDEELRSWLEQSGVPYVLAVPRGQFEREAAPPRPEAEAEPRVWEHAGTRWTHQPLTVRGERVLGLLTSAPGADRRPGHFLTHAPRGTRTAELAAVAAGHPAAPATPAALGPDGLHGHELRTWTAWYRHTSLSLTALAASAVAAARRAESTR